MAGFAVLAIAAFRVPLYQGQPPPSREPQAGQEYPNFVPPAKPMPANVAELRKLISRNTVCAEGLLEESKRRGMVRADLGIGYGLGVPPSLAFAEMANAGISQEKDGNATDAASCAKRYDDFRQLWSAGRQP